MTSNHRVLLLNVLWLGCDWGWWRKRLLKRVHAVSQLLAPSGRLLLSINGLQTILIVDGTSSATSPWKSVITSDTCCGRIIISLSPIWTVAASCGGNAILHLLHYHRVVIDTRLLCRSSGSRGSRKNIIGILSIRERRPILVWHYLYILKNKSMKIILLQRNGRSTLNWQNKFIKSKLWIEESLSYWFKKLVTH